MRRVGETFAVLCVLAMVGGIAGAQVLFDGYDLGLPDGYEEGSAQGINAAGDVVGSAFVRVPAVFHTALIWPEGGNAVPLDPLQTGHSSNAADINDAGWVVGTGSRTVDFWDPDAGDGGDIVQRTGSRAAIWDPSGAVTELPVESGLAGPYTGEEFSSEARAISDGDPIQVVGGYYVVPTQQQVACVWTIISPTEITREDLDDLGGVVLRDTNDAGQVCWNEWPNAYASWSYPDPLPTLGGDAAGANGIGDGGQIVGWARLTRNSHACLWENGSAPVDLGTIGGKYKESYAMAVNIAEQAVGVSLLADSPQGLPLDYDAHATLFAGGEAIDLTAVTAPLSTPAWRQIRGANDINDSGWIVGTANLDDGSVYGLSRPCLLVPAGSGPNQAPVAEDDSYSVDVGGTLTVAAPGVLGNDSDPENDPIIATWEAGPSNGALNYLNADGSFEYVPDPGFEGTDSFTYTAFDGELDSNVATVTITVSSGPVEPGGITGIVTDAGGPVKKAIVTVRLPDQQTIVASGKTLPSGAYTITGLAPGQYTVKAELGDLGGWALDGEGLVRIVLVTQGQTTTDVDIYIE